MHAKHFSSYFTPATSVVVATGLLISLALVTHAEAPPATLTLVKHVIGNADPSLWPLFAVDNTTGEVPINGALSGSPEATQQPVTAGDTFHLFEALGDNPAGFSQQGWKCTGFTNGGSFTAPDQVTVKDGEQVTCIVTNFDESSPSLRLIKAVSDNSAPPSDWQLSASTPGGAGDFSDSGDPTTAAFHRVQLNFVYSVGEVGPAGYEQTGFSCDGDDTQRTVTASAVQILVPNIQITCTTTNSPQNTGGGEKQDPTLSIQNSPQPYTGSPQSASVVASAPGAVSDVKYNGDTSAPSDAGTYAVTADFTPTDSTTYNALNDAPAGTFEITKANSTTAVTCPTSVTYNGTSQEPCTASATGPALNQPLTVSYANNTQVGTATADASFAGDGNHNGSSGSASFTIAKADPTITVTPYSVVFDGLAHTAVGIAKGVLNEVLSGLSLSNTTHTAIGVYNDVWNFVDSTGNYNNKSGSVTDKITFAFGGFLPPITSGGHMDSSNTSIFKAGSTVPVKFQLKNAQGGLIQASTNPPWIVPIQGPAMTVPVTTAAEYTDSPTSGSFYTWDTDHYQYNWKTKSFAAGYWYFLYVIPGDGNVYSTIIGLR